MSYFRMIRVLKILKVLKYEMLIFRIISLLQLKPTQSRILAITVMSIFLVHIFACTFFLTARVADFHESTWVMQRDELYKPQSIQYAHSMYWAF